MTAHQIIRTRLEKLWEVFKAGRVSPSLFDDHATQILKEISKDYQIISHTVEPESETHDPEQVEINKRDFLPVFDELTDVRNLLTERISDMHDIKGAQGERHSFIFYRNSVANAIFKLRELLKQ